MELTVYSYVKRAIIISFTKSRAQYCSQKNSRAILSIDGSIMLIVPIGSFRLTIMTSTAKYYICVVLIMILKNYVINLNCTVHLKYSNKNKYSVQPAKISKRFLWARFSWCLENRSLLASIRCHVIIIKYKILWNPCQSVCWFQNSDPVRTQSHGFFPKIYCYTKFREIYHVKRNHARQRLFLVYRVTIERCTSIFVCVRTKSMTK